MQSKMQALIRWILFLLNSNKPIRFTLISLVVLGMHLSFALPLFFQQVPPLKPASKPIAVRTTIIKQPKIVRKRIISKKRKVVPVKKKVVKKVASKKKTVKPVKQVKKQPLTVPKVVTPQSQKMPTAEVKQVYMQTLLTFFAENLELPEIGTVVAELCIKKDGSVKTCNILRAESIKNRAYIENNLRQLELPTFNGELKKYDEETFEITFRNKL